jgi:hypothetical protein
MWILKIFLLCDPDYFLRPWNNIQYPVRL